VREALLAELVMRSPFRVIRLSTPHHRQWIDTWNTRIFDGACAAVIQKFLSPFLVRKSAQY
jgi:hypothetical protein